MGIDFYRKGLRLNTFALHKKMKRILALILLTLFIFSVGCAKPASAELAPLPTQSESPRTPVPVTASPVQLSPSPSLSPTLTPAPEKTASPTPTPIPVPTPKSVKPADTGNIVSTASQYYGYEEMMADVDALIQTYPQYLTRASLGTSVFGREIPIIIMGNPENQNRILILGASHAREYGNTLILMRTIERYCANMNTSFYKDLSYAELLRSCTVYFVPMHNPDGVELCIKGLSSVPQEYQNTVQEIYTRSVQAGMLQDGSYELWKANGIGQDLNQNYGFGPKRSSILQDVPMSENFPGYEALDAKEARLIVELCRQKNFKSLVSYHSYGNLMYWGFFATGSFKEHCREIANAMKKSNGYRLVADTATPSDYSHLGLKDWFMYEYKLPGYTIEIGGEPTPLGIAEVRKAIDKNIEIPAIMMYYEYSAENGSPAMTQNRITTAPAETEQPSAPTENIPAA